MGTRGDRFRMNINKVISKYTFRYSDYTLLVHTYIYVHIFDIHFNIIRKNYILRFFLKHKPFVLLIYTTLFLKKI